MKPTEWIDVDTIYAYCQRDKFPGMQDVYLFVEIAHSTR